MSIIILIGDPWAMEYILCYPFYFLGVTSNWFSLLIGLQTIIFGLLAFHVSEKLYPGWSKKPCIVSRGIVSFISIFSFLCLVVIIVKFFYSFNLQSSLDSVSVNNNLVWKGEGEKVSASDQQWAGLILGFIICSGVIFLLASLPFRAIKNLD